MAEVTFSSEEGKESAGRGELRVYGSTRRNVLAGIYGVVGVLFGLPTFVPGPHMCVTWVFPLLGGFMALRVWSVEAELTDLEGSCPACDEALSLPGGSLLPDGTLQLMCRKCQAKLQARTTVREGEEAPQDSPDEGR